MTTPLRVLRFEGIHTDTLGHYLCGLGLLSALSTRWPDVRGCWRDGRFVIVHATLTLESVTNFLVEEWQPTKYERWWKEAQSSKDDAVLWVARNRRSVGEVLLADSHLVGTKQTRFNPVFGNAGVVGRRDFQKVWEECFSKALSGRTKVKDVEAPAEGAPVRRKRPKAKTKTQLKIESWLQSVLATPDAELPAIGSTGTWFVFANKTSNSGQEWFRDGRLSPWAFLLAMEGAILLTGDVNRRLSSRARPYAVFPFVCDAAQPSSSGQVGISKAEFWAPIWSNPSTVVELHQLLERGVARLGVRSAHAPHEFAIAAMAAGTDSGVTAFARFDLRQTTSGEVFEAVPQEHVPVSQAGQDCDRHAASSLLMSIVSWLNRLPFEPRDQKQKGKFRGLRGPIEQAILRIGESVKDTERWRQLLLLLSDTQARIDRNKSWREKLPALPQLSPEWFERAWPESDRPEELLVARSIGSIGAKSSDAKKYLNRLLINIFGVHLKSNEILFTKGERPPHVVWNEGHPVRVLVQLLSRRLVNAEKLALRPGGRLDPDYFVGPLPTSMRSILRFLLGELDFNLLARWIPALSLLDWSRQAAPDRYADPSLTGEAALYALFRPIFQPRLNSVLDWLPSEPEVSGKPAIARRIAALLQAGDLDLAIAVAANFYRSMGRAVVDVSLPMPTDHDLREQRLLLCERLAASMLIPVSDYDIRDGVNRWLVPLKRTTT